jgi:hypothetical protein
MFGNDVKNQNYVREEIKNRLNCEVDNETSDPISGEALAECLSDCQLISGSYLLLQKR